MIPSDELLRPTEAYHTSLYAIHRQATQEYITSLTAQSGIDVEQNRKTVAAYNQECETANHIDSATRSWRILRIVMITFFVSSLLAAGICIYFKQYVWLLLCAGVFALSIFIWIRLVNPIVKHREELASEHRQKASALKEQAWHQMEPLHALLDGDITRQLIEKTVPSIKIDRYFDVRRLKHFEDGYGYCDSDKYENMSTIKVISGELNGNPYVIERYISCTMGTCTYTGTREVVWYDTYISYDSEGNATEIECEHYETLKASVEKPKPCFDFYTQLTYGNEAAPNLSFSRECSHADKMSEKKRKQFVKSGIKMLLRTEQRASKKGEEFTRMGNDEFEALFRAYDRNNELQFRLLFTPLAQENMLALMLTPEPYGDDFYFTKKEMLNFICSDHGKDWDMNTDARRYYSYSFDQLYQSFIDYNVDYFRRFFFDFAPILSIPLYQQHKSREQIYGERKNYRRNYASNQAEAMANSIGQAVFEPPEGDTDSILKTKLVSKAGDTDTVEVTAKSFKIINRVDIVPVKASNGTYYDVEVPWKEYIPVSRTMKMEMCALELSEPEYQKRIREERFKAYMESNGNHFAYTNGIFACALQGYDRLQNIITHRKDE